ncbi:MAG: VWA domain-containing protein [Phycisphaerales bacterium]|nr:VWA domain-containing protein [Phycisphaerales bacterium]
MSTTLMQQTDLGFTFTHPAALSWLWIVLPMLVLIVWSTLARRRTLSRFAEPHLLLALAPSATSLRPLLRATLACSAIVLLVLALLDPRWGGRMERIAQSGFDCVVVVDVSRSMLATDATPSRLERAKQFGSDLTEQLGGDRIGLVAFAGVPSVQCPLTFNHRTFLDQLRALTPQSTNRGGSMLGDAIRMAATGFGETDGGRAIVVFTDGEDMESFPVEAAAEAFEKHGARTYVIGIGDAQEGARIPIETPTGTAFQLFEGQEVWSKMDPETLSNVATAGRGFFVAAGTAQLDMSEFHRKASADLERTTRDGADIAVRDPQFQWLAGLALVLLLAECFVGDPRQSLQGAPR